MAENKKSLQEMRVSVIMPVYNCQDFIDECLNSIFSQNLMLSEEHKLFVEICIYEDGSSDDTLKIIDTHRRGMEKCDSKNFSLNISRNMTAMPRGVGYGRNQAIKASTGEYLCFCDADDIMMPNRILAQYKLAVQNSDAIIGSKYIRYPEDSTINFTMWANSLSSHQLYTQIYQSFGPTMVMPTWFCHRQVFQKILGGFDETGKGVPEDLIFFYKHLNSGGKLVRSDEILMIYRYHPHATTFSVSESTIWDARISQFQTQVLSIWPSFTIWNAGKLGRRFFRSLKKDNQEKVVSFCDVDAKKISKKMYNPYPLKFKVPIIHIKDAKPPFVICVKTALTLDTDGSFRQTLDSLNLKEGSDFYYFN